MLWHSYSPRLQKHSKGGKICILCASYKPTMNEKHPGHLGLRENHSLLERVQIPMSLRNAAAAAFTGLLSSRNPQ